MAWYEISEDELIHNEILHMTNIAKRQGAVALIDLMLSYVLSKLGVDVTKPDDDILSQQMLMGIDIQEMREEHLAFVAQALNRSYNPKCLGFYVSQLGEPIAFVSDPYVGSDGVVRCAVEPYDSRVSFNEVGMTLSQ
jgi:hypothetical protein